MNRIQIGYEMIDFMDNNSFINTTLHRLREKGLELPVDRTIKGIAEHIKDKLGFNGCSVVRMPTGGAEFIFYKENTEQPK